MKRELTAQVGPDGVLKLTVPLEQKDANKTVRVIVETVEESTSREEWLKFIQATAGQISDPTFQRHPQGEYEERYPFPERIAGLVLEDWEV